MKRNIVFLCAVSFLFAFTGITGIGEIITGIRSGNATTVAKYFDNSVEISLANKSSNYSKGQGEAVLRDFFQNHPVKSFKVIHQGESGGSQFVIGTLVTSNGTYRTTANLKQKGDKQVLQEIKFEN